MDCYLNLVRLLSSTHVFYVLIYGHSVVVYIGLC